jgi:hypothetical protein
MAAAPHQPGQADFRSILPEDVDFEPFTSFPPSAKSGEDVTQVLPARQRRRAARRHAPLPLGQVRGVHHPSAGEWANQSRLRRSPRRSEELNGL